MEGEHPLFKAWEEINTMELPGNTHPNAVARMLMADDAFCETVLGLELYGECLTEIVSGKCYSEDIVIACAQRLNALNLSLQRRVG